MSKRLIYILICVALALSLSVAVLYASGDELSFALNSDGQSYCVNGMGSCNDSDLVIPAEYNGLPVTRISDRAFEQKNGIYSITLPSSISTIGDFVFSGCKNLKNVYLNEGLSSLGTGAFYNCINLESVSLPESLSVIGEWAFWNCSSISSIVIPGNVSSIGIGAFNGCSHLADINIYSSYTALPQYVFADCVSLRTFTMSSNISSVGEYAFADCYNLSEIFFQNSNVNINGRAFYGVSAKAHYSCSDSSWSGFNFSGYGGNLTWVSHTNITHFAATASTDTSQGNIEYWYCNDCGRYYSDEGLTHEISKDDIHTPVIGEAIRGDVDGNGKKDGDDVLRTLYHLFYPKVYVVNQDLDFNGDGKENGDDVLRLLYNLFYADVYPLS